MAATSRLRGSPGKTPWHAFVALPEGAPGDALSPPRFPGLELDVAESFELRR